MEQILLASAGLMLSWSIIHSIHTLSAHWNTTMAPLRQSVIIRLGIPCYSADYNNHLRLSTGHCFHPVFNHNCISPWEFYLQASVWLCSEWKLVHYNKKICALRKKGHEITERTLFTPFKIAYTAITTGSRRLGFNCEDVVM